MDNPSNNSNHSHFIHQTQGCKRASCELGKQRFKYIITHLTIFFHPKKKYIITHLSIYNLFKQIVDTHYSSNTFILDRTQLAKLFDFYIHIHNYELLKPPNLPQ